VLDRPRHPNSSYRIAASEGCETGETLSGLQPYRLLSESKVVAYFIFLRVSRRAPVPAATGRSERDVGHELLALVSENPALQTIEFVVWVRRSWLFADQRHAFDSDNI
jgi:hypothetical protein